MLVERYYLLANGERPPPMKASGQYGMTLDTEKIEREVREREIEKEKQRKKRREQAKERDQRQVSDDAK
ncbi:hypothetical protein BS50DRAFT_575251 [Corynespora cassiicola Philippines]|uniref:Uncharacterized protein n=1 Tax=Corynespora cassiicola Philippines TaxID=1448308 RepID=A0A2T2NID0_CORCC|nr:hypothetical protein BS50DRAFT_575251 [Corynespora cassiicola Philippines]